MKRRQEVAREEEELQIMEQQAAKLKEQCEKLKGENYDKFGIDLKYAEDI